MKTVFIAVLNMSLTASYAAAAVILARVLLKKAPRVFSYALWAVVLFRMVCPFSFESVIAILPAEREIISQNVVYMPPSTTENIENRITVTAEPPSQVTADYSVPDEESTSGANIPDILLTVGTYLWLAGIIAILCYSGICYIRIKRRISMAVRVKGRVYESEYIETPFVMGFVKPKIYVPEELSKRDFAYVVRHEKTHIRRKDYLIKPAAYLALTLHWFNPLIWASYILMSKDMEMSCDESVMKRSKRDIRASYSKSLLSLSAKQIRLPNPLAFGESNVKTRIKNVLRYRKPSFWISIMATVFVMAVTVSFAANRNSNINTLTGEEALDELRASIEYNDGEVSFTIPDGYPAPDEWLIWISGRAEYEDGFSRSLHFYDEENENRAWEAGKTYTIPADSSYTELAMDIYLPDENGETLEMSIDLMPYNVMAYKPNVNDNSERSPDNPDFAFTPVTEIASDKDRVFDRMLNTIDYYNTLDVTFKTSMLNGNTVRCQTDIDKSMSYEAIYDNGKLTQESICNGTSFTRVDHTAKTFDPEYLGTNSVKTRKDATSIAINDRITIQPDGLPCYNYRANVTNCTLASFCIFPQEIAFSYLKDYDLWEITGEETYLDRNCIVINGTPSGYSSEKHNAERFTMLIDSETGVLMRFTATLNGNVTAYITVEECIYAPFNVTQSFTDGYNISEYTNIQEQISNWH